MPLILDYLPILQDVVIGSANIVNTLISAPGDVEQPIRDVAEAAKRLLGLDSNIPHDISSQMMAIQDRETNSEKIIRLGRKVEYSHKRLIDEARKLSDVRGDGQHIIEDTFAGLWVNPVGLTEQDRPSEPIYNIIAHILSNLNISPVYKAKGEHRDITEQVARVLFDEINPSKQRDEPIVKRSKTIELDHGSTITVSHVFYTVRLGVPGEQYYLHGAINIAFRSSNEQRIAVAKVKERCNYFSEVEREPSWLVTLLIQWATAPTAENAQERFQQTLRKKYSHIKIRFTHVAGVHQFIKVQAPLNLTPEAIRTAVQDAAQDNVEVPPSRHENNQIPLTAQNVILVRKLNETFVPQEQDQGRHSSWVDCVAER